uniref:Predicted protein n=1 Tax=Hordeum vulgare subsp. vulgare TaxID=112509 RepID=F2E5R9_HORVV|nr:predicted protein [Hordeum vulgare subsp. vulgare]
MLWPKQILRLVPMALHRSSSRTYPGYEIFSRGGCPYTTPRCRRPCTLPRVGGARGQGRPVLDAVQVQKDIPSLEALRRRHCRLGGEKPKISSTRPAPLACFQSMCRIGMWPRGHDEEQAGVAERETRRPGAKAGGAGSPSEQRHHQPLRFQQLAKPN